MSGYRVSLEADDPLAVDETLGAQQRRKQRMIAHAILTLVTFGLWLPGLLVWLLTSGRRARRLTRGYAVRIQNGTLVAGNAFESRSVPLDAVIDVGVRNGVAAVGVRGSQALMLYGMRDPHAAARAILTSRARHLQGVRADVRGVDLEHAPDAIQGEARVRRG